MTYPFIRPRRLRSSEIIRSLVRENELKTEKLIYPLFVGEGKKQKIPVPSMPGIFRFSKDTLLMEIEELLKLGIFKVILFGVPKSKNAKGTSAYSENGVIQSTLREVKKKFPELFVVTDVCLCEYTHHGHCGLIRESKAGKRKVWNGEVVVENDKTLELLAQTALSHVEAGADMIAPSDMMDGRVGAIRMTLDEEGYEDIPIMSYAVKYASGLYGPFREAAESAPFKGDRKTYQMDFANRREALREAILDEEEGADILMVKPAGNCLDIISDLKENFTVPIAAYQVSGEYSMIRAAGERGWIDEETVMMESLLAIQRAGADIILTYFSKRVAVYLKT